MKTARTVRGVVAICATAFLLSISPARSQETYHLPTIADCPRGYVLGVQDTDYAQPMATPPLNPSDDTATHQDQIAAQLAAKQAEAPRAFMTGCVLPRQPQNR